MPRAVSLATGVLMIAPPVLVFFGVVPSATCLLSVGAVVVWILLRLQDHAAPLLCVAVAAALASAVVQLPWPNWRSEPTAADGGRELAAEWRARPNFDETLPVIVHLVFDELMSPGAIDPALVGGPAVLDQMRGLAERHQFRVYDSVYSRHFFSGVAIPNMMQADYLGRTRLRDLVLPINEEVPNNAYFSDLAGRGYRTAVFGSAVLNFCVAPDVQLCDTFQSFDPGVVNESRSDDQTRTVHLWDTVLRFYEPSHLSSLGRRVLKRAYGLDQQELGVLGTANRFDVQGFTGWFGRVSQFVLHAPRGTHVFAHVLVPHSPYLLTEDCIVSGTFDAGYYLASRYSDEVERDAARARYYSTYFRQVRCVMSQVERLLESMRAVPALHDALVVIHGDHGSRISAGALVDEQTPADMIDNYAAFYAIRSPSVAPGVDCTFLSLGEVFRRHMRTDGAGSPGPPNLPVVMSVRAAEDARLEVPMPLFGCAASNQPTPVANAGASATRASG